MNTTTQNKTGEGNAPRKTAGQLLKERQRQVRSDEMVRRHAKAGNSSIRTRSSGGELTAWDGSLMPPDANARDVHNETREDLERLADDAANLRSEMGAEIKRLTAQRDELLAALKDLLSDSRSLETRHFAQYAINKAESEAGK